MIDERRTGMSVAQILRMVLLLIFLAVAGWLLYTIRGTLFPFAVAFILSYVLMPLVDRMEARGLNRMIGVLVIYASTLATFVALFILVVPILLKGLDDMKDGIVGERSTWSCVILNRNSAPIKFDRVSVESSDPQFVVVSPSDKEIPPGVQDTLLVEFRPKRSAPWFGRVDLFGKLNEEEVGPIRLYLTGNFQKQTAQTSWEPNYKLVLGSSRFGLSSSTHQFGQVRPGYVDRVMSQMEEMQPKLESAVPMLKGMDLAGSINRKIQSTATEVLKETPALLGGLISGLTFFIIVPLVVFFLLSEGRVIKRAFIEIVPNRYFELVLNLFYRIDLQLGGYIRGLVLSVILISFLSIAGLRIIGLRDFLVVGTIAGISNVIPYLGPLIGILAGIIAALIQYSTLSFGIVLPVVAVFLVVQILDNVFVAPVVVARSVNLHPLVVIFAVLVGNQLFGAVGMILAVPTTAVVKVSVRTVYEGLRSYSIS